MNRSWPCQLPAWMGLLRSPRAAAMAAAAIALPTVFSGFIIDDHIHLLTLDGQGYGAEPFDLFQFGSGDSEEMGALIRSGPYPWYTLPALKLHFFRPLSSALMVLDRALFGEMAIFYHLHSLVWYALLAWGVALLYRRALAGPVVALAVLVFVLDESHLLPALWWSNRNALVAAVPAVFGLVAHLRWRESGWKPGLPLSLLGYTAGLLGGEGAIGILGYVLAYEAVARRDPPARRLRALAPCLALAAVYLALYKGLGHGVRGSGIYFDPVAEWPAFLAHAPGRLAGLVAVQFFGIPVELAVLSNRAGAIVGMVSAVSAVGLVFIMRALWRQLSPADRRTAAWLGLGALIATVPCLATFPSGRLLILPSIGACAFIALAIRSGLAAAPSQANRLIRGAARVFVVIHILLAPLVWLGAGIGVTVFAKYADGAFEAMDLAGDFLPHQRVFCLYAPDPYTGLYTPAMRRRMGYPDPAGWQCLSVAPYPHVILRTAENEFEVAVVGGELLAAPFERLLRSPAYPFTPGDRVDLDGYAIVILETGRWGPSRFRVTFDAPLEDSGYHFLAWRDGRLVPFVWPPTGGRVILSPRDGYFTWSNFKKRLPLL